jgi:hypothetical protein
VPEFKGQKWTQDSAAAKLFQLHRIKGFHKAGLGTGDSIHFGNNSGYQAINLAILCGSRRILLLGFDMQKDPETGKRHWFGDHEGKLKRNMGFDLWLKSFDTMVDDVKKLGVQVINCSRKTALTCFPRMAIQEAL